MREGDHLKLEIPRGMREIRPGMREGNNPTSLSPNHLVRFPSRRKGGAHGAKPTLTLPCLQGKFYGNFLTLV